MTLPFRRRHNDAEATHDRARALSSRRLLEPLDADEAAWLDRHLDACTECRGEDQAFAADRELLRTLRDKPIEPPRDLWAKTSAALDAAASRRGPASAAEPNRPLWRALPVGALAGVLVLLVVVGTQLLPVVSPQAEPSLPVANVSLPPGPTPIPVTANAVGILRPTADGSYEVVFTDPIDKVCPKSNPQCVPGPTEHQGSSVSLRSVKASTITLSPHNDQLVYESAGGTADAGRIYVQTIAAGAGPSAPPVTPSAPSTPSEAPVTAGPTPIPTPVGQILIASGVTLVGDVAYSGDGRWLAFSAAPADGSAGPDLYVYAMGAATAMVVTTDHQTYLAGWLGDTIVASHVVVPVTAPDASAGLATAAPSPNAERSAPSGEPGAGAPSGSPDAGAPIEGHPSSFLFDPATSARTELAQPDVWMPVVDPTSRLVAYWSGTLRSTDGITWELGDGQIVVDGWVTGAEAPASTEVPSGAPSDEPGSTAAADASSATPAGPDASPGTSEQPAQSIGPAGHAVPLVTSHVESFAARFDPEGIRLAVWVSEAAADTVGRLHLVVLDPATAAVVDEPLPGEPALRRFSIATGRLAWVSPSGQDGQESTLQVLAWSGENFGEIHAEPAEDLLIVR